MAKILPFRTKNEPPSDCSSTRCNTKLICPACDFSACSATELYAHMQAAHPPEKPQPSPQSL